MKIKNQKGITLVALVVTIIVLLILAAITINAVIGENGLISKARNAAKVSQEASEKEFISMAYGKCAIEAANGDGIVTGEMIQQALQTDNENLQCSVNIVYPNNSTKPFASIHFTKSGNEFLVKLSDGTTEKVLSDNTNNNTEEVNKYEVFLAAVYQDALAAANNNTKAITIEMLETAANANVGTDTDLQGYHIFQNLLEDENDQTEYKAGFTFNSVENYMYVVYLKDGEILKQEYHPVQIIDGPAPSSGTGVA